MSASCCGARASGRLNPFDCFQRGLATRRLPPLALVGPRIAGVENVWAAFSLQTDRGRIAQIRFACTTCTTLIACCQALVELNTGCRVETPCVPDAQTLWERLPGLPRNKVERTALAAAAFRAALHRIPLFSEETA